MLYTDTFYTFLIPGLIDIIEMDKITNICQDNTVQFNSTTIYLPNKVQTECVSPLE